MNNYYEVIWNNLKTLQKILTSFFNSSQLYLIRIELEHVFYSVFLIINWKCD